MKRLMILTMIASFATPVLAANPCKDKRAAKRDAQKTLHRCVKQWQRDGKPGGQAPTDDCASSLAAFVQASKDLRACRADKKGD